MVSQKTQPLLLRHLGSVTRAPEDSSAGGIFSEAALRRSVDPKKLSIFLKKLKITPEVCNTDLIPYKIFTAFSAAFVRICLLISAARLLNGWLWFSPPKAVEMDA